MKKYYKYYSALVDFYRLKNKEGLIDIFNQKYKLEDNTDYIYSIAVNNLLCREMLNKRISFKKRVQE